LSVVAVSVFPSGDVSSTTAPTIGPSADPKVPSLLKSFHTRPQILALVGAIVVTTIVVEGGTVGEGVGGFVGSGTITGGNVVVVVVDVGGTRIIGVCTVVVGASVVGLAAIVVDGNVVGVAVVGATMVGGMVEEPVGSCVVVGATVVVLDGASVVVDVVVDVVVVEDGTIPIVIAADESLFDGLETVTPLSPFSNRSGVLPTGIVSGFVCAGAGSTTATLVSVPVGAGVFTVAFTTIPVAVSVASRLAPEYVQVTSCPTGSAHAQLTPDAARDPKESPPGNLSVTVKPVSAIPGPLLVTAKANVTAAAAEYGPLLVTDFYNIKSYS
jgi:hypothetical protein